MKTSETPASNSIWTWTECSLVHRELWEKFLSTLFSSVMFESSCSCAKPDLPFQTSNFSLQPRFRGKNGKGKWTLPSMFYVPTTVHGSTKKPTGKPGYAQRERCLSLTGMTYTRSGGTERNKHTFPSLSFAIYTQGKVGTTNQPECAEQKDPHLTSPCFKYSTLFCTRTIHAEKVRVRA